LAESLTSLKLRTGAESKFVMASETAIRADAAASIKATGARSPIANASPA
jgi:hypothetical protein